MPAASSPKSVSEYPRFLKSIAYIRTNFSSTALETNAQHSLATALAPPALLIFSSVFSPRLTTPTRLRNGHTSDANCSYLNTLSAFFARNH